MIMWDILRLEAAMLNQCRISGSRHYLHNPPMCSAHEIRPSLYSVNARNACWISSPFLEYPAMATPDELSWRENDMLLSDNQFSTDATSETGLWSQNTDVKRFSNLSKWQRWKWYSIPAILLTISIGLNTVLLLRQIGLSSSTKPSSTYHGGHSQYCKLWCTLPF